MTIFSALKTKQVVRYKTSHQGVDAHSIVVSLWFRDKNNLTINPTTSYNCAHLLYIEGFYYSVYVTKKFFYGENFSVT